MGRWKRKLWGWEDEEEAEESRAKGTWRKLSLWHRQTLEKRVRWAKT